MNAGRRALAAIVLFSGLLGGATGAGATVEKTTFKNGLTVLTRELRHNDVIAVEVLLRMGPLYETDAEAGISSLTMNLLEKGTASLSAPEIAERIESVGARLSVSVNADYGVITLLATREGLDAGLEILFDVLKNAAFPEKAVEQEKDRQIQAIHARRDQPLSSTFDLFQETLYDKHPYHKPRLGYEETVNNLSRDRILGFYRRVFVPRNMIFSVAGNFEKKDMIKKIRTGFSRLSPGEVPAAGGSGFSPAGGKKEAFRQRRTADAWLVLGCAVPGINGNDGPILKILDAVLGGSMNSRLFVELRGKKGLAYQVGSLFLDREGSGIFTAYLGTRPGQVEQCRQGILDEFARLQNEKIDAEELRRSRTFLKGSFIMSQETNAGQAGILGRCEIAGLGFDYAEKYPGLIDAVTAEDMQAAAKKYLNGFALAAVVPETPTENENKGEKSE